jgi:hypothetical protein
MHENGSLPRARQDGLLVETVGEELLLYDQTSHTAHCLSPIAAGVWRHCDGEHDVTELAGLAGVSESLVAAALRELREKDLLDTEPQLLQGAASGISRREAIVRGVRVSAAAAAVPLIVSATAATPAMASSGIAVCKVIGGGSTKTCCICINGTCVTSTRNIKECQTFCGGDGSVKQWTEESECA